MFSQALDGEPCHCRGSCFDEVSVVLLAFDERNIHFPCDRAHDQRIGTMRIRQNTGFIEIPPRNRAEQNRNSALFHQDEFLHGGEIPS